jgi:iron complex outermembrane receptor protein
MTRISTTALIAAAAVCASGASARAQQADTPKPQASGVYELGQINVMAERDATTKQPPPPGLSTDKGGAVVGSKQIETAHKDTLDQAVTLAPGVAAAPSGGPRNEQLIFVRGFDRWQVPLMIDGVRVYLPADNRLDYGRFLTSDISEVQIAKGYSSVLDGPGGLGGAINLVSRKPTKAVEGEISTGADFGRSGYQGGKIYGRLGTRQDAYYLQASGAYRNFLGWDLPGSFTPTAIENGGRRDHTNARDWNVNLKAGWTPNATDEYSINFSKQKGEKDAPYSLTTPLASQRYWTWPYWNVQHLSLNTHTQIAPNAYIKTKAYWSRYDNSITSYDNAARTAQATSKSFESSYHDWAVGGSVEAGVDVTRYNTLRAAFFARRDSHSEGDGLYVNSFGKTTGCRANVVCFWEPRQYDRESTYSAALEHTFHVTPALDLVQGVSYDWRKMSRAEDFLSSTGPNALFNYPLKNSHALNGQAAAIWRYSDTGKLFANVSDRTRFPTLFERYSSRFGGAVSNPGLAPERAVNYQASWSNAFAPGSQASVTAFYSDVKDMIQSVPVIYNATAVTQSQNVGRGKIYGVEGALDWRWRDDLTIGGNLTLMHRKVTAPYTPGFKPSGVPDAMGLVYARWEPLKNLILTPSVEMAGKRWTVAPDGKTYYRTGAYALANLTAEYKPSGTLSFSAGVKNMFDRAYTLTDGFPSPGRSFFVAMKATY